MRTKTDKVFLKVAVSVLTVFYGLVPLIADLNETHLLNPLWSEHARFHGAWFLAFAAGIALTALFLIWARNEVRLPIVFGLIFCAGFWIAATFQSAYGGRLVDSNGFEQTILGFEANSFVFSVLSVLFIATLVFSVKSSETSVADG